MTDQTIDHFSFASACHSCKIWIKVFTFHVNQRYFLASYQQYKLLKFRSDTCMLNTVYGMLVTIMPKDIQLARRRTMATEEKPQK